MTLHDIINQPIAVNCTTEEDANRFLQMCHEQGIVWMVTNDPLICDNNWDENQENTCYCIGFHLDNKMGFSHKDFYESKNYTIINFKQLTK